MPDPWAHPQNRSSFGPLGSVIYTIRRLESRDGGSTFWILPKGSATATVHRTQYYPQPCIPPTPEMRTKYGFMRGYPELIWALFWGAGWTAGGGVGPYSSMNRWARDGNRFVLTSYGATAASFAPVGVFLLKRKSGTLDVRILTPEPQPREPHCANACLCSLGAPHLLPIVSFHDYSKIDLHSTSKQCWQYVWAPMVRTQYQGLKLPQYQCLGIFEVSDTISIFGKWDHNIGNCPAPTACSRSTPRHAEYQPLAPLQLLPAPRNSKAPGF